MIEHNFLLHLFILFLNPFFFVCIVSQFTNIVFIRIVEGVDDRWVGGPFVFVDWLAQLLQVVVGVIAEDSEYVLQKLVLRDV